MSLISCTSECLYQDDGYCTLERAASNGGVVSSDEAEESCIHFIPRRSTRSDDL